MQIDFDASVDHTKGTAGIGIVLRDGDVTLEYAVPLDYPATVNEAEYEALISGLILARQRGPGNLDIRGDSLLVVKQVLGRFAVHQNRLRPYRDTVRELLQEAGTWRLRHIPRAQNWHADLLSRIARYTIEPGREAAITQLYRTLARRREAA